MYQQTEFFNRLRPSVEKLRKQRGVRHVQVSGQLVELAEKGGLHHGLFVAAGYDIGECNKVL